MTSRSTTTGDHWDTGFASAAEVASLRAGQAWQAYAFHADTGRVQDTATVPADSYYLVVVCRNPAKDCELSYAATAVY